MEHDLKTLFLITPYVELWCKGNMAVVKKFYYREKLTLLYLSIVYKLPTLASVCHRFNAPLTSMLISTYQQFTLQHTGKMIQVQIKAMLFLSVSDRQWGMRTLLSLSNLWQLESRVPFSPTWLNDLRSSERLDCWLKWDGTLQTRSMFKQRSQTRSRPMVDKAHNATRDRRVQPSVYCSFQTNCGEDKEKKTVQVKWHL